jgi:hypothetical protein
MLCWCNVGDVVVFLRFNASKAQNNPVQLALKRAKGQFPWLIRSTQFLMSSSITNLSIASSPVGQELEEMKRLASDQ